MTQHIAHFSQDCLTITDDGSLVSVEELESLYLYWCEHTDQAPLDTSSVLEALAALGLVEAQQDGVDYVEGLVLTGSIVADFILSDDFAGVWGVPTRWDVAALPDVATAS